MKYPHVVPTRLTDKQAMKLALITKITRRSPSSVLRLLVDLAEVPDMPDVSLTGAIQPVVLVQQNDKGGLP